MNYFLGENISALLENVYKSYLHQVNVKSNPVRTSVDNMKEEYNLSQEYVDEFLEITNEVPTNTQTYNYFVDKVKIKLLEKIVDVYRKLSPYLFNIAVATYVIGFVVMFLKKTRFKNYKEMTFLTGILGLYIIRLFVIAYVETYMFAGAISTMYLSSTYSLQFAFEILSPYFLISVLYKQFKKKDNEISKTIENS